MKQKPLLRVVPGSEKQLGKDYVKKPTPEGASYQVRVRLLASDLFYTQTYNLKERGLKFKTTRKYDIYDINSAYLDPENLKPTTANGHITRIKGRLYPYLDLLVPIPMTEEERVEQHMTESIKEPVNRFQGFWDTTKKPELFVTEIPDLIDGPTLEQTELVLETALNAGYLVKRDDPQYTEEIIEKALETGIVVLPTSPIKKLRMKKHHNPDQTLLDTTPALETGKITKKHSPNKEMIYILSHENKAFTITRINNVDHLIFTYGKESIFLYELIPQNKNQNALALAAAELLIQSKSNFTDLKLRKSFVKEKITYYIDKAFKNATDIKSLHHHLMEGVNKMYYHKVKTHD